MASVWVWWTEAGWPEAPKTAAVGQLKEWAQHGEFGLRLSPTPVVGGANLYGWDGPHTTNWQRMHTGICYGARGMNHDSIDGNYQDRVDCWNRDGKYYMGCAVPTFAADVPPPPAPAPPINRSDSMNTLVKVDGHSGIYLWDGASGLTNIHDQSAAAWVLSKQDLAYGKSLRGIAYDPSSANGVYQPFVIDQHSGLADLITSLPGF